MLIIIVAVVLIIALVSVYFKTSHNTANQAVVGDTILLSFNYTTSSVTFTISNIPQYVDINIRIYALLCSELGEHIIDNSTSLNPLAHKYDFDTCSPDYRDVCILGSPYYYINAPYAFLHYKITLSSFIEGQTEVHMYTFDNPGDLKNFLEGKHFRAIKELILPNKTTVYVASANVQSPTYLYVAIKNIRGTVDSFDSECEALAAIYKTQDLASVVELNKVNNSKKLLRQDFGTPTSYKDHVCFLAEVNGNVSRTVCRIHQKGDDHYILFHLGIAKIIGITIGIIAIIIILVLIIYAHRKLCKRQTTS